MKRLLFIALAVILFGSCSPLKKTRRQETGQTVVTDQSEFRKLLSQMINEQMTIRQRVVEYNPPGPDAVGHAPGEPAPAPVPVPGQTVQRVIETEITATKETTTETESTTKSNVRVEVEHNAAESIDEKPPPAVSGIKWTTFALIVAACILLILKLK